jgi:hypothetical protein
MGGTRKRKETTSSWRVNESRAAELGGEKRGGALCCGAACSVAFFWRREALFLFNFFLFLF